MILKKIIPLFLISLVFPAHAQVIKGIITDDKNQPVPFATIYVEDIQSGTTANLDGAYEIKVPEGSHSVLYKSLGYKEVKKQIDVSSSGLLLNIQLFTEVYNLKEVTISAKGEDPAYAIMRKAIALAPYHLREVKKYSSLVYLRGTIYIDKIPKLISRSIKLEEGNQKITLKNGDVYVEETIMQIDFTAPHFYKRKVRSIHSTFPGDNNNPVNPVLVIESSFYEPELIDMISPLAPEAFQHYKFKYLGFSEEGDALIDKIQVIPRRKSQELFSGYIYIVEGKYCLHSIDLAVEQFWGTLNMKGVYGKVNNSVWLPVSYYFSANASYLGVKGRYKYSSSVRYTSTELNEQLSQAVNSPANSTDKKKDQPIVVKKKVDKVKNTVNKESLTNREMKKVSKEITEISSLQRTDTLTQEKIIAMTKRETDSLARKRDTAYWSEFRPIPLSSEEIKSFEEGPRAVIQKVKKDSVELAKDSTYIPKKKKNWIWPVTGKTFKFCNNNTTFDYKGLLQLSNLSFNTVDGFRYGITSEFSFKLDSGKNKLSFTPWIGYAFSRKNFMWEIHSEYKYYTQTGKMGSFKLNAGNLTTDFNNESGISMFMNSIHSMFLVQNYLKLYQKKYIEFGGFRSIKRYLNIQASVLYAQNTTLLNYSNFKFVSRNREYTDNIPVNPEYKFFGYQNWKDFRLKFAAEILPYRKPRGDGYNREYNPWPQATLTYSIGIPGVFNSTSDYQNLSVAVNKRYWLGRNRIFKYKVHSSYWLSAKNVFFPEYSEIKTNYIPFDFKPFDYQYQLLPYYTYNTATWLVGAHIQYQTKLLVLKRLPLISTRMWTENLYLNYLHMPRLNNYTEFGYTLGMVMAVFETGVFVSFNDFKYHSVGLKISMEL